MTGLECDRQQAACSQLCVSSSTAQTPGCSCVPGYTLDPDGTHCVANTWALPGALLVYNDGSQLNALNLSSLTNDDHQVSRVTPFVVLHRSHEHINAIGMLLSVAATGLRGLSPLPKWAI